MIPANSSKIYQKNIKTHAGIITIGNFDGVHIGHQFIMNHVLSLARETKSAAIVYTFYPHPVEVLHPGQKHYRLYQQEQSIHLLQQMGIPYICVEAFTHEFSKMSPEEFIVERILRLFKPIVLVVGENFRFGAAGCGNTGLLARLGEKHHFATKIIPRLKKDGKFISSSLIRKTLLSGKPDKAKDWLGRAFSIKARVVKGEGRGQSLGFPTINLKPSACQLLPADGVYIASVKLPAGQSLPAVLNIGFCPTFSNQKERKIEVHIMERRIKWEHSFAEVQILQFIRPERAFSGKAQLLAQIRQDIKKARQYFKALF